MDPYLENPASWQGFHTELAVALQRDLAPRIRPRYYVAIEERVYLAEIHEPAGVPDAVVHARGERREPGRRNGTTGHRQEADRPGTRVLLATLPVPEEIRERYLEVRRAGTGDVVTVIEILSPSNKRSGAGRSEYLDKRRAVLGTRTSLVEIDLLRAGEPMPVALPDGPGGGAAAGYRVVVARGGQRPYADVYAFTVREPLPSIPIPLSPADDEPMVDLQAVVAAQYDTASYDLRLDYRVDPVPPLEPEDAAWADGLLRGAGVRGVR
jgi:hypothetical protein